MPGSHIEGIPKLDGAKLTGNSGNSYKFGQKLSSGEFGIVYQCVDIATNVCYACKVMNLKALENCIQIILREVDILKSVHHPHLLNYREQLCVQDLMFIFTEFVDGGDLSKLMLDHDLDLDEIGCIVYQILQGVAYLHEHNICHRDLKPANILCTSAKPLKIVIADFGLSRTFGSDGLMSSTCGSSTYAAPEVYNHSYTAACDMWSLGLIINEMIRGPLSTVPLFSLEYDAGVPSVVRNFVEKLIQYDPAKRMSAREALNHEWMIGIAQKYFPTPVAIPSAAPVDDTVMA